MFPISIGYRSGASNSWTPLWKSSRSFTATSEFGSGTNAFQPTFASMTSFTVLSEKWNADVLKSVLCDHPLANLFRSLVHAAGYFWINGTPREKCFRNSLFVFQFSGDGLAFHELIVGHRLVPVNWKPGFSGAPVRRSGL